MALTATTCTVENTSVASQKANNKLSLRSLLTVAQRKYSDMMAALVPQQNTNSNVCISLFLIENFHLELQLPYK